MYHCPNILKHSSTRCIDLLAFKGQSSRSKVNLKVTIENLYFFLNCEHNSWMIQRSFFMIFVWPWPLSLSDTAKNAILQCFRTHLVLYYIVSDSRGHQNDFWLSDLERSMFKVKGQTQGHTKKCKNHSWMFQRSFLMIFHVTLTFELQGHG